ncbi:metal ABC transporter substrate-binding protein [Sporosarcina trichiuri]|uniref:metal ABC transporter substrate-binding protein n=1 Tax=Sporosarcina trichiuri TaxID=3056445 RepID=UPI0025B3A6D6|nr:metal ABC transporter substrate-binding protein [Sporosarcina sp. 0.2-SM1T-5]WJY27565.1 metal ABC transporter substrate-binding protein [Sporosarcina sp. 0.2-SM1T-5]
MNKVWIALTLAAGAVFLGGCQQDVEKQKAAVDEGHEAKLSIVTSFYPMYEFTKEVVGDNADVTMLIPASVEPHDWEPAAKDLKEIQDADALVYNNENMETWIHDIEGAVGSSVELIDASEGIELLPFTGEAHEHEYDDHDHDRDAREHEGEDHDHGSDEHSHEGEGHEHGEEAGAHEGEAHDHEDEDHEHEGHHHDFDPHLWLSPARAITEVETIAARLGEIDPDHKSDYEKNRDEFVKKLKALDKEYQETLSSVSNKEIITQHAAFGYVAADYGLTQVPIAGLSPDNEPSAKKLKELKEFAEHHDIHTIFFEENASSKVAETLAAELQAKTAVLHTLEGLSEDEQNSGATYISVMSDNLHVLAKALR